MTNSLDFREPTTDAASPEKRSVAAQLLRPGWLIALPALVSIVAWAIPWPSSVRTGYSAKETLTASSATYLIAWYALLALAGTAGWVVGRNAAPLKRLNEADDDGVYRIISVIGAVGVIGMYALVQISSPDLIPLAFRTSQFNLIRNAVSFAPGMATLRYATIVSGGIALYRIALLHEQKPIHFANVVFLILNVAVASRLALLMSLLIAAGLYFRERSLGNVRPVAPRTIVISLALVATVLTATNYLRNANFYEAFYGTSNPITMVIGETVAYTGSPAQVAIGTANASSYDAPEHSSDTVVDGITALVTPTFTGTPSEFYTERNNWYRGVISVEEGLTTNSSLASIVGLVGMAAFPFMAVICFFFGMLMGHFARYRSYQFLGALIVGYAFTEIWRVYIFNTGVFIFSLLVLSGACLIAPRRSSAA